MLESTEAKQPAIAAVARHFAAPWQSGEGPPEAYLTVDGRTIALDVAVIARQRPAGDRSARARLRDDKVTRRVLPDIEGKMRGLVPDGKSIVLTLGAPIKVPNQLVAALTATLSASLESGVEEVEEATTISGNRVRFRILNHDLKWKAPVLGFVFSGDPEPGALASAMRSLHEAIAAKAKAPMPAGFAGDRWLVLDNPHWIADIKTYRRACSQLSLPHAFGKILMIDGRRVETLAEDPSAG
jgi:hypothetical protein